jgi:hypothetical protein
VTHNAKVLALLSDGKPHTHHELYALGVIAHSRVSSLRAKGYEIACWRERGRGETVSVYQLVGSPPVPRVESEADCLGPDGSLSTGETEQLTLEAA